MTIADANELLEHWADEPPLAVVVKAYLNVKPVARTQRRGAPRPPAQPKELTPEQFERMRAINRATVNQFGSSR
jgi:hypothetical protein